MPINQIVENRLSPTLCLYKKKVANIGLMVIDGSFVSKNNLMK